MSIKILIHFFQISFLLIPPVVGGGLFYILLNYEDFYSTQQVDLPDKEISLIENIEPSPADYALINEDSTETEVVVLKKEDNKSKLDIKYNPLSEMQNKNFIKPKEIKAVSQESIKSKATKEELINKKNDLKKMWKKYEDELDKILYNINCKKTSMSNCHYNFVAFNGSNWYTENYPLKKDVFNNIYLQYDNKTYEYILRNDHNHKTLIPDEWEYYDKDYSSSYKGFGFRNIKTNINLIEFYLSESDLKRVSQFREQAQSVKEISKKIREQTKKIIAQIKGINNYE